MINTFHGNRKGLVRLSNDKYFSWQPQGACAPIK
jgi:hypothetical protein